MKLDKKTVEMLSSLPDDKLWQMIALIASSAGARLPSKMPDEQKLDGLRKALANLTDSDITRATEIIDIYNGKNKTS